MLTTKIAARIQGAVLMLLLTACAGAMIVGAGCRTYAEARLDRPSDAVMRLAPASLVNWLDSLDAGMTTACTK